LKENNLKNEAVQNELPRFLLSKFSMTVLF